MRWASAASRQANAASRKVSAASRPMGSASGPSSKTMADRARDDRKIRSDQIRSLSWICYRSNLPPPACPSISLAPASSPAPSSRTPCLLPHRPSSLSTSRSSSSGRQAQTSPVRLSRSSLTTRVHAHAHTPYSEPRARARPYTQSRERRRRRKAQARCRRAPRASPRTAPLTRYNPAQECFNSPYGHVHFPVYAETIAYTPGQPYDMHASASESVKLLAATAREAGVWLIGGARLVLSRPPFPGSHSRRRPRPQARSPSATRRTRSSTTRRRSTRARGSSSRCTARCTCSTSTSRGRSRSRHASLLHPLPVTRRSCTHTQESETLTGGTTMNYFDTGACCRSL